MDREQRKLTNAWKDMGKLKYPLLAALGGVLLLLCSGGWVEEKNGGDLPLSAAEECGVEEREELEQRMEEILGHIQGVGRVEVMLTVHSGAELVLAQDQSLRYSGATQAPDDYDRAGETVVLSRSGNGEDVVVTQERYPQYRGALVVCQGGGNDAVRLQVVAAVSALTGLGTDRIAVMKWGGSESDTVKGTVS